MNYPKNRTLRQTGNLPSTSKTNKLTTQDVRSMASKAAKNANDLMQVTAVEIADMIDNMGITAQDKIKLLQLIDVLQTQTRINGLQVSRSIHMTAASFKKERYNY